MKMPPLQNRAGILLFFLFLWAALVAAHLFFYTVIARDKYIKRGNAIALRNGPISGKRGKLLDKEGKTIAWSEIYIDLYVDEIPEDPFYRSQLQKVIREYFPYFSFEEYENKRCLRKNLSPMDQIHFYNLIKKHPEIIFKTRKERRYISDKIEKYLIDTGIEKCTMGKNGLFNVMVDRNGKWIPGTWEEIIKPLNGNDIKLELTLSELEQETEYPVFTRP